MASLLTLLDAVNMCIMTSGEQPVNSLSEARADVHIAKKIIQDTALDVQAQGWRFNTEYELPLTPDDDGEITLGSNIIRLELTSNASNVIAVIRGNKLYDTKNRTYVFPAGEYKATVVYALDFAELPQAARQYIAARASRIFTDRYVGDQALAQYARDEEQRTLVQLRKHDLATGNYRYLDGERYKEHLRQTYRPHM